MSKKTLLNPCLLSEALNQRSLKPSLPDQRLTSTTTQEQPHNMDYPKPVVVEPLRAPHKHTFILLHGRGSNGEKFGLTLLETPIASDPSSSSSSSPLSAVTLRDAFPHARFVFPTAAWRRATIYKRALTHQWFNNWKLDPPATDREDLQVPGLCETTTYLHTLLHEEIGLVPGGAKNIVLGGLSQGCAASLTAILLWEGERLGAVVGMCGWLPFAERLIEQINGGEGDDTSEDDYDPFARDNDGEEEETELSPAARAVGWLREELGVLCTASPSTTSSATPFTFQQIPFFLGHGVQDETVSIALGRRASECLSSVEGRVCWEDYNTLGHWYSGQMLRDIVHFIQKETGWSVVETN